MPIPDPPVGYQLRIRLGAVSLFISRRLLQARQNGGESLGSITANEAFMPNYGDRYRYGEAISTAFVESPVNQVISKRMVKQQQMHWTKKSAHLIPLARVQMLNEDLRPIFERWYPTIASTDVSAALAASLPLV
jgi:hypothetical protein